MLTKAEKKEVLAKFIGRATELMPQAQEAYGSRATESENHDISREFTFLLVQYVGDGGSLQMMADALGTTISALQRRVKTYKVEPLPRSTRSTAPEYEYTRASERLNKIKKISTFAYHTAIKEEYDRGLSLNKLARHMGLKGAYPLYYGLNNARMRQQ